MKDSKSILLLVVSVMLILVSFALLWTWGYNFNSVQKELPAIAKTAPIVQTSATDTRDSLQKIYSATIQNLGTLDSTWAKGDSLKSDLDLKLNEFYKLRNEIATILKAPAKKEDLDIAQQKITELQKKIDQLRNRTLDVESENRRLYAVLEQLTANGKASTQQPAKTISYDEKRPASNPERNSPLINFATSDLRLAAMMVDGNREQETYQALQTDKFVGSFNVKSPALSTNNTEIFVVVVQPDNKVLQTSAWESGRFETREGKKVYSCKLHFENAKGENKKLSFSLNADKLIKGTYTMQLYINGDLIGKASKTLI